MIVTSTETGFSFQIKPLLNVIATFLQEKEPILS